MPGLKLVQGDTAFPAAARGSGTVTSGPIAASGVANDVVLAVHCTAASGTTPTLNVSLEESADGSTSWTAVTGSGITQLTAAGNAVAFATPTKSFVRVTATVAGTTPSFTFKAVVLIVPGA